MVTFAVYHAILSLYVAIILNSIYFRPSCHIFKMITKCNEFAIEKKKHIKVPLLKFQYLISDRSWIYNCTCLSYWWIILPVASLSAVATLGRTSGVPIVFCLCSDTSRNVDKTEMVCPDSKLRFGYIEINGWYSILLYVSFSFAKISIN